MTHLCSSKKILITGANGFVGKFLVKYLSQNSHAIIAATRDGDSLVHNNVERLAYGSLPSLNDLSDALKDVEVIVHCAARAHVLGDEIADPLSEFRKINTEGSLVLAQQADAAGVKRLIFLSSIGVNGNQTTEMAFTAADDPNPNAPYAVSKLEAELVLKEFSKKVNLEIVIIRPPLIIGPDPVGNLAIIARFIQKGLPLPFGLATKNKRSMVSIDNLASLIELCLYHSKAEGQVFMVADEQPFHTRKIIESVGKQIHEKVRFLPVPIFMLRKLLKWAGKQNMDSQLFDNLEVNYSETTKILGWKPQD